MRLDMSSFVDGLLHHPPLNARRFEALTFQRATCQRLTPHTTLESPLSIL